MKLKISNSMILHFMNNVNLGIMTIVFKRYKNEKGQRMVGPIK